MKIKKFFSWIGGSGDRDNAKLAVDGIFGNATPEARCGIDPASMSVEEMRSHLATLYKRHNQAAGSLDPELRTEAEDMLDAIVHCREKYVDTVS